MLPQSSPRNGKTSTRAPQNASLGVHVSRFVHIWGLTVADLPCRQAQLEIKKLSSSAMLAEADLHTKVTELEANNQRLEKLHANELAQLYARIELLEADACSYNGKLEHSESLLAQMSASRESEQQRADELTSSLRDQEQVCP